MPRLRVGVVLPLPPPHSIAVDALRAALGDQTIDRIPPHLTLVPPVNIRGTELPSALELLRHAASTTPPFVGRLGPASTFWPSSPVVMLPCTDGAERVAALREAVFRAPLLRTLSWPYVPHVTLAPEVPPERIPAVVEAVGGFSCSVGFGSLQLLTQAKDLTWTPLASFDLTAKPLVTGRGGLELELVVGDRPDPEAAAWEAVTASPNRPFSISARREGAVAGIATGSTCAAAATIICLAVDPALRRQGIGSHLLTAVERLAVDRGCSHVSVQVRGGAETGFYRSRGWTDAVALPFAGDGVLLGRRLYR